ncbi:mitochondrial import inner membrane translocase subunit TIM50-like [Ostrea edulis]|uniref:mitochondrial import inner membrane translocase subunit TIM50-like n=1 Tax=Ostrea edulis TaxID=37623 RepID=UPI0024AEBF36|nr:mitochondrial import inner membrane translocase subunit TIM50-like [Ostrea edulis]
MSALRGSTCLFKRILSKGTNIKCDSYENYRTISSFRYLYQPNTFRNPLGVCACVFFRRSNNLWFHNKGVLYSNSVTSDINVNNEKEDDKKSKWKKYGEYFMWFTLASVSAGCAYSGYVLGLPVRDPEGTVVEDEFGKGFSIQRSLANFKMKKQEIEEPSRKKLLPEPLQAPFIQPPYTLVIEITGILVKPEWTIKNGWRFKKRPGVDYFLQAIGPPLFETVVYTSETGMNAVPVIHSLDQQGHIMYKLYRDATLYDGKDHVKDLSYLNRDLNKVIMVDCKSKAVNLQRRNAFVLKEWDGNENDTTLFDLASFLQTLAHSKVDDVRTVLDYYMQFEDPIAKFRENQLLLQEEQERLRQMQEKPKRKSPLDFAKSFKK